MGLWHDSEIHSFGGSLGQSELDVQLEESTKCFQYEKTDSEATGPTQNNWATRCSYPADQAITAGESVATDSGLRRLRGREADNQDSPNPILLPHLLCSPGGREPTSRAGRGNPMARTPGLGRSVANT
jgi:hypothetical protein